MKKRNGKVKRSRKQKMQFNRFSAKGTIVGLITRMTQLIENKNSFSNNEIDDLLSIRAYAKSILREFDLTSKTILNKEERKIGRAHV